MLASEDEIKHRVREVAERIAQDYKKDVSLSSPLILICVLKGSFVFTADLSRALGDLNVPNIVDFLCLSSYHGGTSSSGEVRMLLDLRDSIRRRHCLIVEDIVDSATTLDFLFKLLLTRSPASLRVVACLDKREGRRIPFVVNYALFDIPNEFVVGYGLDFHEQLRDLRDIIVLKSEMFDKKPSDLLGGGAPRVTRPPAKSHL